jgi:hypothetical protein
MKARPCLLFALAIAATALVTLAVSFPRLAQARALRAAATPTGTKP